MSDDGPSRVEFQVTSWRELPSLVVARDADGVSKVSLPARFQEAIDEAAMRLGETSSEDYLMGWERSDWTAADGSRQDVADRVAAELEARWDDAAVTAFLDALDASS